MTWSMCNKVVIVTGASAGIGAATAAALAQDGAHLILTSRREDRLVQLREELIGYPGERVLVPGDIRQPDFCHNLIHDAVRRFGRIDVLINNAGIGHHSLASDVPMAHVQQVIDTNLMGPLFTVQATVPYMKQQGHGQIINISSIVGQRPLLQAAVYSASKSALNVLSRSLRMELRQYGITVTLVYPGLTATEFTAARLGKQAGSFLNLKGVPPERVARAIIRAIRYRRQEVYATWYDWLITHGCRLFPRTVDFVAGRFLHP